MAKKSPATFEVAFVGKTITPETMPLHALSDALRYVQRLASGQDPDEESGEAEPTTISLIDVKRGSARYPCVARRPDAAIAHLRIVGDLLGNENADLEADLQYVLRPIERLSQIARSLKCEIVLRSVDEMETPLAIFRPESYDTLARNVLLSGESAVVGRVERVGGATQIRCALRVQGMTHLLYCDVAGRDISQRLGQHLYEEIVATGRATWLHRTWTLVAFTISGFYQPKLRSAMGASEALRKAGGDAWDAIEDPDAFLHEIRQ